MDERNNPIAALAVRFEAAHRDEAARLFGFDPASLRELEATAFVYEGLRSGRPAILKITPGLRHSEGIMGASRAELEAEVDYVAYLVEAGLPVAANLPSLAGRELEELVLDEESSFFAYCFEKAPGEMYPDEDEVSFPDGLVREWGRLFGLTHRLAPGFRPRPGALRKSWREDDCLISRGLVPEAEEAVHARFAEVRAEFESLPETEASYGIVHGDFHHGNFLAEGERLTMIDFDAARYFWFTGDVATALFNCLPLPREREARRRDFALGFLSSLLAGYIEEFPIPPSFAADLSLFLFANELSAYGYRYKNWSEAELKGREAYISSIRQRLEERRPVVDFEAEDIPSLLRNLKG